MSRVQVFAEDGPHCMEKKEGKEGGSGGEAEALGSLDSSWSSEKRNDELANILAWIGNEADLPTRRFLYSYLLT